MIDKISQTAAFLTSKGIEKPDTGIIVGTGLHKLPGLLDLIQEISYTDIPGFPTATLEFHKGTLLYGNLGAHRILVMNGRFHLYEGWTMQEITFPIRVMKKALGVKNLLISNAAGALNPSYKKGELMLLDDHINLLGTSPLVGLNHDNLGPRFPDMSQPYSGMLNDKLLGIAKERNIVLHKGVYVAVTGPNLETRAEYRFLRTIGADAVGMSTVPEVIVANHAGLPCAAISVLTDECDPDNLSPISISEIMETASRAEDGLIILVKELIREL